MFSLGSKLHSIYQIGRKGLDRVINIGRKIQHVAQSDIVRDIVGMLPSEIRAPLQIAGNIGSQALTGLESLQNKLNTGEQLVNRVAGSVKQANRSVELPKRAQIEEIKDVITPSMPFRPVKDFRTGQEATVREFGGRFQPPQMMF
jgi:hypothetical protein